MDREVKDKEIFSSYIKVRSYECDLYNHVNNAVYLNYLEFARLEAMEKKEIPLEKLKEMGFMLLVQRIEINYKYPAKMGDRLLIRSHMKSYRKSSGVFHQEIFNEANDHLIAEADVLWASVDMSGRLVRIPEVIRAAFHLVYD